MTNLAAEARANAQVTWPGATVNARGRNWIRHEHPTNPDRFIVDSHIGPIHYGVSDDQEIDTAWIADTTDGFTHAMTANNFTTRVRADQFNAGDIFRFEKGGEWVRFDPQSINWIDENTSRQQIAIKQNVVGAFDDDVVSFPEAYGPGRHFEYVNKTAQLRKLITIDAATDLPAVTLQGADIWFEAEFSFSLSSGVNFWIDGVEWARANGVRVQTANQIEIRDTATGTNVLWWLGFPQAWDSAAEVNETVGQLEVRRQGGPTSLFITVRIPKAWIDAATFPIFIDPTIDAEPAAGGDDGRWHVSPSYFSSSETIPGIGYQDATYDELNGFFRFPGISIASGSTIDTSYMSVYANSSAGNAFNIFASDAADPSAPTTATAADTDTRTTASASWSAEADNFGWENTSSLNSVLQELIDSYEPYSNEAILIYIDNNVSTGIASIISYDYSGTEFTPSLHIEYTTGGGDSNAALLGQIRRRRFQPLLVR